MKNNHAARTKGGAYLVFGMGQMVLWKGSPLTFFLPCQLAAQGTGAFVGFWALCQFWPLPNLYPRGPPSRIGSNKRGPVQRISVGSAWTEALCGSTDKYPSTAPFNWRVWLVKTPPALQVMNIKAAK